MHNTIKECLTARPSEQQADDTVLATPATVGRTPRPSDATEDLTAAEGAGEGQSLPDGRGVRPTVLPDGRGVRPTALSDSQTRMCDGY